MRRSIWFLFATLCLLSVCQAHRKHWSRDAGTQLTQLTSEGEDHAQISAPAGSTFTSIVAAVTGEEVALFTSQADKTVSNSSHAFIIVHGKLRNGGEYWKVMNDIVQNAIKSGVSNVDSNSLVISPQLFSTRFNSGQYTSHQLAWDDVNAWEAGDAANQPAGTKVTSIDVLDSIIASLLNASGYPSMKNITVVGHGGGGQLVQRYAAVGKDFSKQGAIHIRYIHADPSSCAYFTTDRPTVSGASLPSKSSCSLYNTWRYGFDNFTGSASEQASTPQQYFARYISRDVVSMVGYQDTKASGDNNCPAVMQGGMKRRDRNLVWWRYINTLARTSESLNGFPGEFSSLPDWSATIASSGFQPKLIIVENATHNAKEVFSNSEGLSALFAASDQIVKGYRPAGGSSVVQSSAASPTNTRTSAPVATSTAQTSSASRNLISIPIMLLGCMILFV